LTRPGLGWWWLWGIATRQIVDVTADGIVDIVVAGWYYNPVFGNANGASYLVTQTSLGVFSGSVIAGCIGAWSGFAGNLDHDTSGLLDVVTSCYGGVLLSLQQTPGSFSGPTLELSASSNGTSVRSALIAK
jgi:hypothetical protein